ncbi:MAG TPA: SDR family NAD(P)-dependent oxidoreductase [Actinomycetes bacterium]|nr:SDR family NAD(P)-dependent oxidoreductase [Actinomycetes bacterium]
MRGLAGKRVLVSGGSRGIGQTSARRFLEEGCSVFLTGLDADEVEAAVSGLASWGTVAGTRCDVSSESSVNEALQSAVAFLDGIDVLANNAGIAWQEPFLDMTASHWDRVIAVNLRGMFLVGQAVARHLVAERRPGVIVNMASTNALGGEAYYAHYNASKGAVLQLTRTMAVELGVHGIRVNALCPGYIETPLNREIAANSGDPDFVATYVRDNIPLGRTGSEEDVAAAYAFLASDEAAFVHGAALVLDGGQTAVM